MNIEENGIVYFVYNGASESFLGTEVQRKAISYTPFKSQWKEFSCSLSWTTLKHSHIKINLAVFPYQAEGSLNTQLLGDARLHLRNGLCSI